MSRFRSDSSPEALMMEDLAAARAAPNSFELLALNDTMPGDDYGPRDESTLLSVTTAPVKLDPVMEERKAYFRQLGCQCPHHRELKETHCCPSMRLECLRELRRHDQEKEILRAIQTRNVIPRELGLDIVDHLAASKTIALPATRDSAAQCEILRRLARYHTVKALGRSPAAQHFYKHMEKSLLKNATWFFDPENTRFLDPYGFCRVNEKTLINVRVIEIPVEADPPSWKVDAMNGVLRILAPEMASLEKVKFSVYTTAENRGAFEEEMKQYDNAHGRKAGNMADWLGWARLWMRVNRSTLGTNKGKVRKVDWEFTLQFHGNGHLREWSTEEVVVEEKKELQAVLKVAQGKIAASWIGK